MDLSHRHVLPVPPRLKGPVERDRPGPGTVVGTATAIPAFFGVQDDGRLAFPGIWHIHVYLAYLYAMVASVTNVRVEQHWIVGCRNIGKGDYFSFGHPFLQN
jgi:hypothetical protein